VEQPTEHIIERMGLKFEQDGLPRAAGLILGRLLLAAEPLSLDDLAADLGISKASASTNARLLERLGAAERAVVPGDRRDYYYVHEELHNRILEERLRQIGELRDLLLAALQTPAAQDVRVRARLDGLASLFGHLYRSLGEAAEAWREERGLNVPAGQGAGREGA
jgi:DNA-binding transcriptional regulator GbsR (MarR family)